MPLYSLDGVAPQLPASGNYWIAPDAHVIGAGVDLREDMAKNHDHYLHGTQKQ